MKIYSAADKDTRFSLKKRVDTISLIRSLNQWIRKLFRVSLVTLERKDQRENLLL